MMPNNRRGFGRATSGSEWRTSRKIGRLVRLPTGNTMYINQAPANRETAIEMLNALCRTVVVYPKLIDNPKEENEISLDDLSLPDKIAILTALLEAE